jgi:hypothetical protein
VSGFQWLDGSFLEHVELLEGRSPNDLDVVTFFHLPAGATQADIQARAPDAFPATRAERTAMKGVFHVDPYYVSLVNPADRLVRLSAYWYSVWSHRRDATWRGYLQIGLDGTGDAEAAANLRTPLVTGAAP